MSNDSKANLVAIVTGASRGIGEVVARGLAQDGYKVMLVARSKLALDEICVSINQKNPGSATGYALDVSDEIKVKACCDDVKSRFGEVDLLFNNAGIYRHGSADSAHLDYDETFNVNMRGSFNFLHEVVPEMKLRGNGIIINLASIAGVHGFAGSGVYAASKFAMVGMNESLFRELSPLGIRVCAICPHWVNTEMGKDASIPAEERIQPADILETIRYLLKLPKAVTVKEIVLGNRLLPH